MTNETSTSITMYHYCWLLSSDLISCNSAYFVLAQSLAVVLTAAAYWALQTGFSMHHNNIMHTAILYYLRASCAGNRYCFRQCMCLSTQKLVARNWRNLIGMPCLNLVWRYIFRGRHGVKDTEAKTASAPRFVLHWDTSLMLCFMSLADVVPKTKSMFTPQGTY